jgi:host factor-I protein
VTSANDVLMMYSGPNYPGQQGSIDGPQTGLGGQQGGFGGQQGGLGGQPGTISQGRQGF